MVRRDGQGKRDRVTDLSLVRLLGSFADRLFRHSQPHALILYVDRLAGLVAITLFRQDVQHE